MSNFDINKIVKLMQDNVNKVMQGAKVPEGAENTIIGQKVIDLGQMISESKALITEITNRLSTIEKTHNEVLQMYMNEEKASTEEDAETDSAATKDAPQDKTKDAAKDDKKSS